MLVNELDYENESDVLEAIKDTFLPFKDLTFIHKTGASVFDFFGYYGSKKAMEVDVKVRDATAYQYPTLFVSRDKVDYVMHNQTTEFYLVYYFKKSFICRIYHLNNMEVSEKEIAFKHKRTGEFMEKRVFEVPTGQFDKEYYFVLGA